MPEYVELHCHSNYSFHDGASQLHELLLRAKELGYLALALTDHDNLCGAMEFARLARSLHVRPVIGAEVTLKGGGHITLLAENHKGYSNLCRLISYSYVTTDRREPELDPRFLAEHAQGLILLTGCPRGPVPRLLVEGRYEKARSTLWEYLQWFGPENVYVEMQQNLVYGDTRRNCDLVELARDMGVNIVTTNNVHYHVRERHRLQDCLVAIRHCKPLEETHRERRANSEFHLKSVEEMTSLFHECPEAIKSTLRIAERCSFDLTRDLSYRFPDYPVPEGYTPDTYLAKLCLDAARRRYRPVTPRVRSRLEEELRLIRKHNLAGFLLIYHDIVRLAWEAMIDLGLADPERPPEDDPPGRGRGSSVAMLVGYLLGLSHIDPLRYNLSLERFLPDDALYKVPDIDLDFPRNIREELIKRVHQEYGWDRAALTGMIDTYKIQGAIRDMGKALSLPPGEVDRLAKRIDRLDSRGLRKEMLALPGFKGRVDSPGWGELIELSQELINFPKYLAQHPGGMIISSTPLIDLVPVQPGAIEGRYICQWDKDSIEDAGFVKIDFLGLGALSQIQEALEQIEERHGRRIDLSRIDFEDERVYDMLHRADTIGVFQVESAAQIQTIPRIKPRNLVDMAHEVGAVRPGVGINDGVRTYIRRRMGLEPVSYDHPLEKRALERTLGVILFQDQVNQLAIDVAGMAPSEADQVRRAFKRHMGRDLVEHYWERFRDGALTKGVPLETARSIFEKFNGEYMFPESHAFAFGVTAYQAAWLKYYYPIEFYLGLFNQQPMGFYNLETLKEDARRHGLLVLNPDINKSFEKCVIEGEDIRLGFVNVKSVGEVSARAIVEAREKGGPFRSLANFMARTGLFQEELENLADAGAFDPLNPDRRQVRWEIGLRYTSVGSGRRRPIGRQLPLSLSVGQDMTDLPLLSEWQKMAGEYRTMGLYPSGHVMAKLRPSLGTESVTSEEVATLEDEAEVVVAGLVVRRQRPLSRAVFITLEDEFGHIPCMVFPKVYERYRLALSSPLVLAYGVVSRRDGTMNVLVTQAEALQAIEAVPKSKDWG